MPRAEILPQYIVHDSMGQITGSLGKSELEQAAAVLVRALQLKGATSWEPLTMRELSALFGDGDTPPDEFVAVWGKSPFWRPDFGALAEHGFVEGWVEGDPDAHGRVTQKFQDALYKRFGAKAEAMAERATP